jgi:phage shock protein PspC (stress-responsive transcriptional regulator)
VLDERVHAAKADGRHARELPDSGPGNLPGMILADFLGWDSQDWTDTIGIVGVFFVAFPLLVHGIVGYIAAQIMGERQQNQSYARGEETGSMQG